MRQLIVASDEDMAKLRPKLGRSDVRAIPFYVNEAGTEVYPKPAEGVILLELSEVKFPPAQVAPP